MDNIILDRPSDRITVREEMEDKSGGWGGAKVIRLKMIPKRMGSIDEESDDEMVMEPPKKIGRGRGRGKFPKEPQAPGMSAAEREKQLMKVRLARFKREADICRTSPIKYVKFEGATSPGDAKRGKELVFWFSLPKLGLKVKVTLPEKYPEEPPVLEFIDKIPIHPEVDESSGRILRFWPNTYSGYIQSLTISNMMLIVLGLMENATIPDDKKPDTEDSSYFFIFPLSSAEFHYLLQKDPAEFIKILKEKYDCRVQYRGMDKRSKRRKDPHLLICGKPLQAAEVMTGVENFLVEHGFKRQRSFSDMGDKESDVCATIGDTWDTRSLDEFGKFPVAHSASSVISMREPSFNVPPDSYSTSGSVAGDLMDMPMHKPSVHAAIDDCEIVYEEMEDEREGWGGAKVIRLKRVPKREMATIHKESGGEKVIEAPKIGRGRGRGRGKFPKEPQAPGMPPNRPDPYVTTLPEPSMDSFNVAFDARYYEYFGTVNLWMVEQLGERLMQDVHELFCAVEEFILSRRIGFHGPYRRTMGYLNDF